VLKVIVRRGLLHYKVIRFFTDAMFTENTYLDILENFALMQLEEHVVDVFQNDGAVSHYSRIVHDGLSERLPGRWIGRGGLITWPQRSPDFTLHVSFMRDGKNGLYGWYWAGANLDKLLADQCSC
jgi:hypothetical protein